MQQRGYLLAIVLSALLFRIGLATMIENPGLPDAVHYYDVGRRVFEGQGLTEDYIWHFNNMPTDLVHPIDHWMPLSSLAVAFGMSIGGANIHAALLLFILAGALLPLLVYAFAKQLELSNTAALLAACFAISLPDILWNSLRTDTSILNMLLVAACIVLFTQGIQNGKVWFFIGAGVLAGLSYLNRNDSILLVPLFLGVGIAYRLLGEKENLWKAVFITTLAFLVTIAPWLWRSYTLLGVWGTPEGSRMFFMVDQRDHYAYNTEITLETMLAQRTIPELIAKRLFEFAAAIKQIIISMDVFLPVLIPIGAFFLLKKRKLLAIASPVLLWMLGILIAYPFLIPYKSQSGSFEKAYLTILPLLLPLGALALERLVSNLRWQVVIGLLAVLIMGLNSFDVLRQETSFANTYYARIAQLIEQLDTLPDLNNDGQIRLMTQDPYLMSYFGYQSMMIPLASREDILDLAARYQLDYLIMPPARPSLDALYQQREIDPRFEFVAEIPSEAGRAFEIYAFHPEQ